MGFGGISLWQLLIVLVIVIVIFGTKRLSSIGGDLGGALKGFRKAMSDAESEPEPAPKKLDDPAVIRAALEESGIDAGVVLDGIQEPSIKARLLANTEDAVARGVFGSPSFFVGDEHFFGKDRLEEVEREIVAALER